MMNRFLTLSVAVTFQVRLRPSRALQFFPKLWTMSLVHLGFTTHRKKEFL